MDVDEGAADVIGTKDGGSDCIYVSLLFTVWKSSMNRRDSIFFKTDGTPLRVCQELMLLISQGRAKEMRGTVYTKA